MKKVAVACLVLLAAGLACSPDPAPEPQADAPPVAAEPVVPPAIAKVIEERNTLHKRQTGALLTISARWEQDPGLEKSLRIYWSIDYNGPRQPFVVLTPALLYTAAGQSTVYIWFDSGNGQVGHFKMSAGHIMGAQPLKTRDWFSTSVGGKPVTGRIQQGASYMRELFGREPTPGNPPIWVQLEHSPTDRGDGNEWPVDPVTRVVKKGPEWTLDAWTGRLLSPVVLVSEK
jgi:hypothetical protein